MTGGRKVVLQDATAAFMPGHNYGVLGINGAGKSTLIRLLAGSEMPDRGRIRRHARVSFPLGFGGTFHGTLTGRENVAFIARIYGAGVRHITRYVEDFAELGGYFRYYGAKDQTGTENQRSRFSESAGSAIESAICCSIAHVARVTR